MSTRTNERASFFGSIRIAVAGICDIFGTIGTKSAQVVELTFDSQIEDIKHTYGVKLADNTTEYKKLNVNFQEVAQYLAERDTLLSLAKITEVQPLPATRPTTPATPQSTTRRPRAPRAPQA